MALKETKKYKVNLRAIIYHKLVFTFIKKNSLHFLKEMEAVFVVGMNILINRMNLLVPDLRKEGKKIKISSLICSSGKLTCHCSEPFIGIDGFI
ncbi:hypothetical protein ACQKKK_16165 [Peribacillus sp. NPDC006672]|uniref:hypothetical protein n=1 Tax=Peribacillus sp. NPDC006672 TaxID=3390606 RepID=UPI003CFC7876